MSLKTYSNEDPAIEYSTGWTRNGTYMQSGVATRQYSRAASTFKLVFDGPAVWIWGFCGRREEDDDAHYGRLYVNNDGMLDLSRPFISVSRSCRFCGWGRTSV
jgi:hypothetical protein